MKRRLLSLALAICSMSMAGVFLTPTIANAGTGCVLGRTGTNPVTVGILGQPVHVPGVEVSVCDTFYGSVTTSQVTPRVEPGACEPSVFDPACFSVYLDIVQPRGFSNFTVTVWIDGVAQPPISVDVPPVVLGGTLCVVSVGYRVAPDHFCAAYVDLGQ